MIKSRGSSAGWIHVLGSRTWVSGVNDLTTTLFVPNGNNEIIVPPPGELWLIRYLTFWYENSDPLVWAGGATFIRMATEALNPLFTIGPADLVPQAWINSVDANFRQASYYVVASAMQNVPTAAQLQFVASTNAGSISGTLHWAYEYHVMATGL